jgi:hypothetical protein
LKILRISLLALSCSITLFAQQVPPVNVQQVTVAPVQQLTPAEATTLEKAWASGPKLANTAVTLNRGFLASAPLESLQTDAAGIARTSTKFWERIEIHLPRVIAADHVACLMVNSKCQPLPVGASIDKKASILYWHVPNAYKGDFDLVFLQPGSLPGAVRVTTGTGVK